MKKSVDIIGQPVVSITQGKQFGHVKELLINSANSSIAALVIDDGKCYLGAKLVPFAAITGLGEYAVTINSSDDIVTVVERPDFEKLFEANIKIIGTKVMTKGGKIPGKINEITFDSTGKINFCEMEKPGSEMITFPAEHVITFGKEVVIIAEDGEAAKPEVKAVNSNGGLPLVQSGNTMASTSVGMPAPQVVLSAAGPVAEAKKNVAMPAPQASVPVAEAKKSIVMPAPQVVVPSTGPVADSNKGDDDLAKYRNFLLGKKSVFRIEGNNGIVIVNRGDEITEEVLQKAKLAGKFNELIKAPHMEGSLR